MTRASRLGECKREFHLALRGCLNNGYATNFFTNLFIPTMQIDEKWYDIESASAMRDEITNLICKKKMQQGDEDCTCDTVKKWENCLVKRR